MQEKAAVEAAEVIGPRAVFPMAEEVADSDVTRCLYCDIKIMRDAKYE